MCRDRWISLARPVRPSPPVRGAALWRQDGFGSVCWVGSVRMHFLCALGVVLACGPLAMLAAGQALPPHQLLRWRHSPSLPGTSLLLGTLDRILLLLLFKNFIYIYMRSKLLRLARGVCLLPSWGQRPCREKHHIVTQMYEEHPRCADL